METRDDDKPTNWVFTNPDGITIKFLVNAEGNQSLDLDDVSLIVA